MLKSFIILILKSAHLKKFSLGLNIDLLKYLLLRIVKYVKFTDKY